MTGSSEGAEDIVALLKAMNAAIRSAHFEEVQALSARLEPYLDLETGIDARALKEIRHLATRNAACLEAAAQGLRAGRRRLAEIAAAGRVETYDRKGGRQPLTVEFTGRRL